MSAQPSPSVLAAIDTAIAALTVSQIEQHFSDGTVRSGDAVPLLDRSIGHDLVMIEKTLGASGTLLSASAASIDEALLAMQEAREMLTAAVSNVRPAPLFVQAAVTAIIEDRPSNQVTHVPVLPINLVDQPRRSENPRLAKANDDQLSDEAQPARPTSPSGRQSRIEPILWNHLLSDYLRPEAPSFSACYRRLRSFALERNLTLPAQETLRRRLLREVDPRKAAEARMSISERLQGAGKCLQDAMRDLGPVVTKAVADMQTRHHARPAEKLELPQPTPHTVTAPPASRSATPFRPLPFEQRRARFTAAESFLKRRGILVTVVDRDNPIRTYRITGRKGAWLLDDVVAMAQDMGMPING